MENGFVRELASVKSFPTVVLCTLLFLGYSGLRILNFNAVDEVGVPSPSF